MNLFSKPKGKFVEVDGTLIEEIPRSDIPPTDVFQRNGTAPEVINFPALYNGYALDVLIDNLDAVATLTFRINSRSGAIKTISPSGAFTVNDQKVVLIEIVSGTNWEITFSRVGL